jgi:Mg2+ and Co2+ transporter CorA
MSLKQVISYSATQITERLDSGRVTAEQFAKVGMVIAAIAGVVAPLGLVTSFYGMNVQEFTSGATVSLFEFWEVGIPLALITGVFAVFLLLWMKTSSVKST